MSRPCFHTFCPLSMALRTRPAASRSASSRATIFFLPESTRQYVRITGLAAWHKRRHQHPSHLGRHRSFAYLASFRCRGSTGLRRPTQRSAGGSRCPVLGVKGNEPSAPMSKSTLARHAGLARMSWSRSASISLSWASIVSSMAWMLWPTGSLTACLSRFDDCPHLWWRRATLLKIKRLLVGQRPNLWLDDFGETSQHLSVDLVGLRQLAHGTGEVADLAGIGEYDQPFGKHRRSAARSRRWLQARYEAVAGLDTR